MFLQEKVDEFNKKFKILENVSDIVVWGAGVHTCKLFEKTELLRYSIRHIIDIDENKWKNQYFGFSIENPEDMEWGGNIGAVVISVPGKEAQIASKLEKQIGFRGTIIRLYEDNECTPFYRLYDRDTPVICYMGNYNNWDSAKSECKGYDDHVIIDKVIDSTRKVLTGEAVWERDSFLFYTQKYVYSICAAILRCSVQNDNRGVRILDVGGALGSTYFQNRKYLADVKKLEYVVAEQGSFAEYGHHNLENNVLKFINSKEDFSQYGYFDIVLMSASLQYIVQYKEIISKIIAIEPRYIILDRILVSDRSRICKEIVPEEIYGSSYPVMIFTEDEIIGFFGAAYEVIEKDISSVPEKAYFEDGKAESKYYVFQKA